MERRTARIGVPAYQGQEDICMKRSEINAALKEMEQMIREYQFAIPPFCNFTPEEWKEKGHDYDEIRDNMLGWDITDYGLGDFDKVGFSLITIRNGNLKIYKILRGKTPVYQRRTVFSDALPLVKDGGHHQPRRRKCADSCIQFHKG
jgi:hypothetical protein